ncbi:MAG: T9SS type A sorting domain-containing protein, partial [Saprospiraceae bacterium]|nr:T9SS type A sorting domain-containing protein [Candidatus Brachybacter algidus]
YPNPSKDYLHIELMQAPTSQTILIRNYTGRIVKEFSITNEKATRDITDLSQGVYWLQDQNEEVIVSLKCKHVMRICIE